MIYVLMAATVAGFACFQIALCARRGHRLPQRSVMVGIVVYCGLLSALTLVSAIFLHGGAYIAIVGGLFAYAYADRVFK